MSVSSSCIKLCLFASLVGGSSLCLAATPELSQVLLNSQARLTTLNQLKVPPDNLSSSVWLSGLPSISLSHLGSVDNSNSYEQELSVNLPFKSPALHSSDKQIQQLAEQIHSQQTALQGLYLSGLLRQSLWEYRLSDVKLAQLDRKQQLLDKLQQQQQQLTAAGELPLTSTLLLERESVDIALARAEIMQQRSQSLGLFTQLTGQETIPSTIDETARPLENGADTLAKHPLWQLLTLQQQQHLLLAKSQQAGEQAPWTVSLSAKNTADTGIEDQQLGISVSVPLTLGSALSTSDLTQWQQAHTEQSLNLDRTALELKNQWEQLVRQRANLVEQQNLLHRALRLSRSITEELAKVKDQDPVSYEVWLRRYMEALDTESLLALNRVTLQQLHSQQLQALGISL
ncbi:MAG: metal transporter [Shewanella sp.]